MTTVFLIGFPGAGKTTLGRAASRVAGVPFVDLDEVIEERCGMSVSDIFTSQGEAAFRRMEAQALADMAGRPGIVACGGGTPCQPGLMDAMLDMGTVVWLTASPEKLKKRLCDARDARPAIAAKSDDEIERYIADTLAARSPHYCRAHLRFDADRLDTPEELDASVALFLEMLNNL